MAFFRYGLGLLILGACPILAMAQRAGKEVMVIYHDGFTLKGQVHEKVGEIVWDKASGRPFPILSGEFVLDDRVRSMRFSLGQVQKVNTIDPPKTTGVIRFDSYAQRSPIYASWLFQGFTDWDEKGIRHANFLRPGNKVEIMEQRVATLSSQSVFVVTSHYPWNLSFFPQEFTPEWTRDVIFSIFDINKKLYGELKDPQKMLLVAAIMQECGWYAQAESELQRCIDKFPSDKKVVQEHLDRLKQIRAGTVADNIEQMSNVGQHGQAIARLESSDTAGLSKLVTDRQRQTMQDLKAKYAKAKSDLEQAREYLRSLPALTSDPTAWTPACDFIGAELNHDTLERLERFLDFADQHDKERKGNRKTTQTPEEVLALAVTGWLQGKQAAESDPKMALKLISARQILLEYLGNTNELKRANLLSDFKQKNELGTDEVARLITMIPPPAAHDLKKLATEPFKLAIQLPGANGGSYFVQLPPDYHHLRAYPVLMLLHSGRDKADEMVKRFSEEAKKYGVILVAPLWTEGAGGLKAGYQYSLREHDVVTETLRDLRRRFQVDSDRVFLFGWEDGGTMALDVGLGHPDLFAGVVPMNAALSPFTRTFLWTNAQYLPLYIIEGDKNGGNPKSYAEALKRWMGKRYMTTYVEYRGRASEWYSAEVPMVLNWMSRKKRHHPIKQVGLRSTSGPGTGEEFRTARNSDNRFYWLSTEEVPMVRQFDVRATAWPARYYPATLVADLTRGNNDAKGKAQVWNQVDVHVSGLKNVTLWLEMGMMDYSRDLLVRVNSESVGGMRKIQPRLDIMLDELYKTGDRQRLYVGKIDVKIVR